MHARRTACSGTRSSRLRGKVSFMHQHFLASGSAARAQRLDSPQRGHRVGSHSATGSALIYTSLCNIWRSLKDTRAIGAHAGRWASVNVLETDENQHRFPGADDGNPTSAALQASTLSS